MVKNSAGYWLALIAKIVIAVVVAVFLGAHSVNFFSVAFPSDQSYYSYLGFGLTGGAVFAYLLVLKYGSASDLQRVVALIMLLVSVAGELLAAGFGMQIEIWQRSGWQMTQDDFDYMLIVVQVLGLAHALALIAMLVGDDVQDMFDRSRTNQNQSEPVVQLGKGRRRKIV